MSSSASRSSRASPSVRWRVLGEAARLATELQEDDRAIWAWEGRLETAPNDPEALDGLVLLFEKAERWRPLIDVLAKRGKLARPEDDAARRSRARRDHPQRAARGHRGGDRDVARRRERPSATPTTGRARSSALYRSTRKWVELAELLAGAAARTEDDRREGRDPPRARRRAARAARRRSRGHRELRGRARPRPAKRGLARRSACAPQARRAPRRRRSASCSSPTTRPTTGASCSTSPSTASTPRRTSARADRDPHGGRDALRRRAPPIPTPRSPSCGARSSSTRATDRLDARRALPPRRADAQLPLARRRAPRGDRVAGGREPRCGRAASASAWARSSRRGSTSCARRSTLTCRLHTTTRATSTPRAPCIRVAGRTMRWDAAARVIVETTRARDALEPRRSSQAVEEAAGASSGWDAITFALASLVHDGGGLSPNLARDVEAAIAVWHRDRRGDPDAAEAAYRARPRARHRERRACSPSSRSCSVARRAARSSTACSASRRRRAAISICSPRPRRPRSRASAIARSRSRSSIACSASPSSAGSAASPTRRCRRRRAAGTPAARTRTSIARRASS